MDTKKAVSKNEDLVDKHVEEIQGSMIQYGDVEARHSTPKKTFYPAPFHSSQSSNHSDTQMFLH